ncbi:hypothetical protein LJR029_003978 [Caballeronia sp. LjRoot29]|uniref:hypothetical protein n=1 Tax=Caballeronia sp. LjRoot29 TaxID=3342315 RepID=UPI003ECE982B
MTIGDSFLNLKVNDRDQSSRFAIGTKNLRAFSDVFELHQSHYRLRYETNNLSVATSNVAWSGEEPAFILTTSEFGWNSMLLWWAS